MKWEEERWRRAWERENSEEETDLLEKREGLNLEEGELESAPAEAECRNENFEWKGVEGRESAKNI